MEPRLPLALETAKPPRKRRPLGRAYSRPDSTEPQKDLCNPIHIECLRLIHGRRERGNSAQTVVERRVYRRAAPVLCDGAFARASDSARCLCAVSAHERRARSGDIPGVGRQNAAVCRTGCDRYCGNLSAELSSAPSL